MNHRLAAALAMATLLVACVTINVYFPEAAAERAADRIVQEVYGQPTGSAEEESGGGGGGVLLLLAGRLLDVLVPAAEAQNVDIDVQSPTINKLIRAMQSRHARLRPYYASGAVGITADAMLEIRDRGLIPLPERNTVLQLVAEENRDRTDLYAEIAKENGRPEWESRIREVFAERWVSRAERGWYYRTQSGDWRQK